MAAKKGAKAKAGGKGSKTGAKKKPPAKSKRATKSKGAAKTKRAAKSTKRKAGAAKTAAAKRRTRARKSGAAAAKRRRPRKAAASTKRRQPRKAAAATKRRRPARKAASSKRRPTRRVVFESELALDTQPLGLGITAEPPIDRDPASFVAAFRTKLEAALAELAAAGKPFKLVEGFRTTERQQWLFGSGRPNVVPFGRTGDVVTKLDGVTKRSRHQGNGTAGSGRAADCYPTKNGKVFIPKASDPVWKAYADAVEKQGLVAGLNFTSFKDAPHCELPP